jgi:hypothetical protein
MLSSDLAGDLLYVRLLGQDFVVLNSEKVARALLDQRSTLYSDRPVIPTHTLYDPRFPFVATWLTERSQGSAWILVRSCYPTVTSGGFIENFSTKLYDQSLKPVTERFT